MAASVSRDNQDGGRIASPEMLPWADPLPHLIYPPPSFTVGAETGRISMATRDELVAALAGRYVWQPEGTWADPGRIRRCEWLASQARDGLFRAGQANRRFGPEPRNPVMKGQYIEKIALVQGRQHCRASTFPGRT